MSTKELVKSCFITFFLVEVIFLVEFFIVKPLYPFFWIFQGGLLIIWTACVAITFIFFRRGIIN